MVTRIAAMVMLCASLAWAQPATAPATQPAAGQFPTPAELIEQLRRRRAQELSQTKVAYIEIDDLISEKPAGFSLFGGDSRTLHDVIERLQLARDDNQVQALLLTIGAGASMNLAQAQEIRDALGELRRAGKQTFVYADAYDTISYTLASGATNVCLPEGGEILMPGVGMETMFYKGTLDKVGIAADYVQIGEYKGAQEPYTRTTASEELRGEMNRLTESLYGQIVEGISMGRNLSSQSVRQMIDDAMLSATVAKNRGFVDHLVDVDGLRDLIAMEIGNEIDLVHDYGEPERPELDLSNPLLLLSALSRKPEPSNKPEVALIYAEGTIVDGEGGTDLLGGSGVGSDEMRRALRIAARDQNIKAIVLRIDSPGGSALASEMIWQAMRRLSRETEKPLVVSIGAMAASGGYYLASAGDYIFADRCAIVGSIGVVGGKFVLKDLYDKLGLVTETFAQGRNANLFSSNEPFDERQRRMIRTWMQQTYDQFTQRVMTMRKEKIQDIDKVARGRIFLAQDARALGMVDELGGCEAAISYAAGQAGLEEGGYELRLLPAPQTLAELLTGGGADAALPFSPTIRIGPDSVVRMLPHPARQALLQQIEMIQLLQRRPVVLMSPFVVSVK